MSRFLILAVALCVGCAKPTPTPPTVASTPAVPVVTPVDDGFTSDADLVRFKDKPGDFVGKTLKVRAEYYNSWSDRAPDVPLPNRKQNAPFKKRFKYNGGDVEVKFSVDFKDFDVPNGSVGETFVIEFECREINRVKDVPVIKCYGKSISR